MSRVISKRCKWAEMCRNRRVQENERDAGDNCVYVTNGKCYCTISGRHLEKVEK